MTDDTAFLTGADTVIPNRAWEQAGLTRPDGVTTLGQCTLDQLKAFGQMKVKTNKGYWFRAAAFGMYVTGAGAAGEDVAEFKAASWRQLMAACNPIALESPLGPRREPAKRGTLTIGGKDVARLRP